MNATPSTPLDDERSERARAIAAQLGETAPEALDQISRLLKLLGEEVVQACLAEALAIQASGGEQLPNGGRPRTLGGIFFRLTRMHRAAAPGPQTEPPDPAQPPPARRQPMPWAARIDLLPLLQGTKGKTMSLKVMLSGRPGQVERREGTVVLSMAAGDTPPLPRGVPRPPAQPAPFVCYIDAQQWAEVEPALADPADALILDGFCAGDPETGTVAVYVQNATTRTLQRARADAAKGKSKRGGYGGLAPARRTPQTPSRTFGERTCGERSFGERTFGERTPSDRPPAERAEAPRGAPPPVAPPGPPPEATAAPGLRFLKGQRVRHAQFGEGEVIRSEPRDGDEAVTVDFASSGLRRVLARAAGLQIIEG